MKFFSDIGAALMLFTRLPFWRIFRVPADSFRRAVPYWPLCGWITAAATVLVYWGASRILPLPAALLLALLSRVLLTGALHEDGLADFFDGFGGGTSRQQILDIMKDSRIGTYGVIGLLFYFALLYALLASLPLTLALTVIAAADPFGKFIAAQIINCLPYARKEEESKNRTVYNRMGPGAFLAALAAGILPGALFLPAPYRLAAVAPAAVFGALVLLFRKKLSGYTGDCCGALFLLCELSFYLAAVLLHTLLQ